MQETSKSERKEGRKEQCSHMKTMTLEEEAKSTLVVVAAMENVKPAMTTWTAAEATRRGRGRCPFKLNCFDQLTRPTYVPLILFYRAMETCSTKTMSNKLKASLSQTLAFFYPLSGRVKDNAIVDDFDAGVPFVESRVSGHPLSEFLQPPKLDFLNNLIPIEPYSESGHIKSALTGNEHHQLYPPQPQVVVQMTTFECGGIALGLSFCHKIVDAATMSAFLNTWAAQCRRLCDHDGDDDDDEIVVQASIKDLSAGSSVFPPLELGLYPELLSLNDKLLCSGRKMTLSTTTRRFVFSTDAVLALKSRATGSIVNGVEMMTIPTRTEALGAFLWESIIAAAEASNSTKPLCLKQAVNLRPRMTGILSSHLSLSDRSIGNLSSVAVSLCDESVLSNCNAPSKCSTSTSSASSYLAGVMREGLARCVDERSLRILCSGQWFDAIHVGEAKIPEITSPSHLMCSSWLRFGFSDVDFGWGKPIWTSLAGEVKNPTIENVITLKELGPLEEHKKNGTEAWITLDSAVMTTLEKDSDFLEFASRNPSILF